VNWMSALLGRGPLARNSPGAIVLGFIESAKPMEMTSPSKRSTVQIFPQIVLGDTQPAGAAIQRSDPGHGHAGRLEPPYACGRRIGQVGHVDRGGRNDDVEPALRELARVGHQ
jgi:hypothetical protein